MVSAHQHHLHALLPGKVREDPDGPAGVPARVGTEGAHEITTALLEHEYGVIPVCKRTLDGPIIESLNQGAPPRAIMSLDTAWPFARASAE